MFTRIATIVALTLSLGVGTAQADGHIANAGDIYVAEAKTRPMIPNRPAGIYMMIENVGGAVDTLVSASSPAFEVMELHETTEKDGVMRMAQVTSVEVPAGGLVALKPGGLHVMGFHAPQPLKEGATFPLNLTFETAGELTVMVKVGKIGGGHEGHDHGGHDHEGHGHNHDGHNHGTTN